MYNARMAGSTTKLLNVRLNAEDAQKADFLRGTGVEISDLVRQAIREEYQRRRKRPRTPEEVKQWFEELYRRFPTPPNEAPYEQIDTTDRRAMSEYIRKRLKAERPK